MDEPRAIAASWLITGDPARAPIRDGAVVLDAEQRIVALGPAAALRASYAELRWETLRAVLLPGLVNAHTHLEFSALRGAVPGGFGFGRWVSAMMAARDRCEPERDIEAIEGAVAQLVSSGTAAVGEVSNTLAAVAALGRAPLRGVVFNEIFGIRREVAEVMLGMAEQHKAQLSSWPANLTHTLAPHSPYSLHPGVLSELCAARA